MEKITELLMIAEIEKLKNWFNFASKENITKEIIIEALTERIKTLKNKLLIINKNNKMHKITDLGNFIVSDEISMENYNPQLEEEVEVNCENCKCDDSIVCKNCKNFNKFIK